VTRNSHDEQKLSHPFDTSAPSISKRALDNVNLLSGDYWGELRSFLSVAKAGSLSRAADAAHTSHTKLARDIRRLQDQMGCQIAVITKHGFNLTDRGRALVSELLSLDQRLFAITSELRAERESAEGLVRLGITDGLAVVFLVPELKEFSSEYPKISIQIKSPSNFRNLRENQTDVILGFYPDESPDVTCRSLGWLHFLPVASNSYIDSFGVPTADNLGNHRLLESEIYSATSGPWDAWHNLVGRAGAVHHCDASITYGLMVKAGLGIGLLANYTMMEPTVQPLDLGVAVRLHLHAVALTERLQSKPVRLVFDLLEKMFGEANPWFQERLTLRVSDQKYQRGYASLFNC
jgi:DNA-binding transcriptional LysR family regulator